MSPIDQNGYEGGMVDGNQDKIVLDIISWQQLSIKYVDEEGMYIIIHPNCLVHPGSHFLHHTQFPMLIILTLRSPHPHLLN